jgi:hypothetical protein
MPLIEITALRSDASTDVGSIVRALNRAVAEAVPCRLEAVWTTWRWLDGYAVGVEFAERMQPTTHGPVVHVYARRPPEALERVAEVVEQVLMRELQLDESNVFVTTQPVWHAPKLDAD